MLILSIFGCTRHSLNKFILCSHLHKYSRRRKQCFGFTEERITRSAISEQAHIALAKSVHWLRTAIAVFLERVPIYFGTLFLFRSITNLGCIRFVCKQAFTRSFARALWESRSSPLFLEEFFQKSSSFFCGFICDCWAMTPLGT